MADQITLFDSGGTPTAYIDVADGMTVYLWGGKPVAYLAGREADARNDTFDLFGFDGQHLGWYEDGLLRDHQGLVVGFSRGASNRASKPEGLRGPKQLEPLKKMQSLAPVKPLNHQGWSRTPLLLFLGAGRD
ncbi:MAG TPA: hypothetical protein VL523_01180 [Terriglobia bacterium]|nr:hypothetical protein [Terriglobia bacterium]